jgi:hypothetical protein
VLPPTTCAGAKSDVSYPNDLRQSVLYGKSVRFPKSMRYLNNVLCALTDMLCRKSKEMMAGDVGGVDKELVRFRHVKHCAAVHAGHQLPDQLHQGPATSYSTASYSAATSAPQQQQQRSDAVHADMSVGRPPASRNSGDCSAARATSAPQQQQRSSAVQQQRI